MSSFLKKRRDSKLRVTTDERGKRRYSSAAGAQHKRRLSAFRMQDGMDFKKTTDIEYDKHVEEFKSLVSSYTTMKVNMEQYMKTAQNMTIAGVEVSQAFGKMYTQQDNTKPVTAHAELALQLTTAELGVRKQQLTEELGWYDAQAEYELCHVVQEELNTIDTLLEESKQAITPEGDLAVLSVVAAKHKDLSMRIKKFLNFSILAVQVRKIDTILDTANVLQDDLDENANVLVEVDHYTLKVEKLMKKGASSDQLKRNREKQAEARHKYNDIHKNAKVSLAAWVAAAPGQSIAIYNAFLNAQQQAFTRTQTLLQRLTSADVAVVTTIADKTALEAKDQTIQQQTEAKAEQQEKKPVKPLKPTFTEPLKPVTPVKPRRASTIPPPMLSVDAAIVEEEKDVIAEEPEAPQALASMESLISSTTSMKVVAESSVVVENAAAEDHNAADHATEQTSEELFIG